jgi:hypothetical protein
VAYSWDSDYVIGDNRNEGLLLSYENTISLDWQGYSLDGQTNKTILGNKTISIPINGPHRIQVFGNDSLGTNYQSDLKHFHVGFLPIFPVIPGYDLYLIIGALSVISALLIRKRLKS